MQPAEADAALSAAVQLLSSTGSNGQASPVLRDFCSCLPSIAASCSSIERVYGALSALQV